MDWQGLLEADRRWTRVLRVAERPGLLRRLAILLAHSGDSWFWLAGLLALWLWGDSFWKARAIYLGLGVLVTAAIVMLIKFSVRRRRPEGEWGGIYRNTDPHSFPSGHAARAVMLAVLVLGAGPAWLGAILLVWAPLVALARVAMGLHYLSDVLAGMLIGLVIALAGVISFPIIILLRTL
ncbi:MAG: phosphatase PAP2 family protein [Anaerolineales bacterium]|nr:phosphatase PAP2 family protein [Anaerolineales bacterium]